jgi:putative membrane protein
VLSTLALAGTAAHWTGPWGAGFGWLFLLIPLFWIGVFVLLFTLVRRRQHAWGAYGYGPPWSGASQSAESTLGERFAKGDIDETEYRARLEVLRANAFPQPRSK